MPCKEHACSCILKAIFFILVGRPIIQIGTYLAFAGNGSGCLVAQSCPTLCDTVVCNLLGSTVHGIFQARILELAAIFFSRGTSDPEIKSGSPVLQAAFCIAGRFFTD